MHASLIANIGNQRYDWHLALIIATHLVFNGEKSKLGTFDQEQTSGLKAGHLFD
jgi:hypothetical protein